MDENNKGFFRSGEDSDMKIAGPQSPVLDDGEQAALEYAAHKANGNIDRAYQLGERLSGLLFSSDALLSSQAPQSLAEDPFIRENALILLAFVVDTVLEHGCPDSFLSQTALNYFHEQVELRSPQLYRSIQISSAYSLYLLCTRDAAMSRARIGVAFADVCDREEDAEVARLGDRLAGLYYQKCETELAKIKFVSL